MAIVQQLTWEVTKADLEALLNEAGSNYTALQFKMCIDDAGATQYLVSLVGGYAAQSSDEANAMLAASGQAAMEKRACPVPPGCQ